MQADLQYKQVNCVDLKCSCGHIAPSLFKIDGVESPTRFFEITKNNIIIGIYCEPCLIIANFLSKRK